MRSGFKSLLSGLIQRAFQTVDEVVGLNTFARAEFPEASATTQEREGRQPRHQGEKEAGRHPSVLGEHRAEGDGK